MLNLGVLRLAVYKSLSTLGVIIVYDNRGVMEDIRHGSDCSTVLNRTGNFCPRVYDSKRE